MDIETASTFNGRNREIFDCFVCCNPNKIDYVFSEGGISDLVVGDGNE